MALSDYLQFFRLHRSTPNLGAHITQHIVPTIRFRALKRITRAYRPDLEVRVAVHLLGFSSSGDEGSLSTSDGETIQEGREWIQSCGGILSRDGTIYITKDSDGVIHEPEVKKNSLI